MTQMVMQTKDEMKIYLMFAAIHSADEMVALVVGENGFWLRRGGEHPGQWFAAELTNPVATAAEPVLTGTETAVEAVEPPVAPYTLGEATLQLEEARAHGSLEWKKPKSYAQQIVDNVRYNKSAAIPDIATDIEVYEAFNCWYFSEFAPESEAHVANFLGMRFE